ncbi:MAG: hypothetical protein KC417_06155 [Myxococcales bacterium]|nr:hypothetical protein [Myxococcales bacterium]
MLKGSALPLSDGVELTYANGEWSATVCLRPDYNEVYYYEVSRYGELEDGGVSGDVDTNFVEFNPFSPTAYDGNLGTVNLVAYAETCEDFDPTPYGWSEAPHVPADCSELLTERPHAPSGVYAIDPDGDQLDAVATYCDMDTDGGGWTLVLGGDLSGDNGANGYFDGNGVGAPSPFAEFKLGVDAQALSDMAPTELWVQTYSGHSAMFEISSTAGFSADYTSCNEGGKSLGGTVYWHAGRAGCYGSSHLGVSVGTDTVEANTVDTLHYGHFHRSGVNTGVYVFGENPAGTKQYINENEWEEQFAFWVRD